VRRVCPGRLRGNTDGESLSVVFCQSCLNGFRRVSSARSGHVTDEMWLIWACTMRGTGRQIKGGSRFQPAGDPPGTCAHFTQGFRHFAKGHGCPTEKCKLTNIHSRAGHCPNLSYKQCNTNPRWANRPRANRFRYRRAPPTGMNNDWLTGLASRLQVGS